MKYLKSRLWIAPVLVLSCLLVQPMNLTAQCSVSTTQVSAGATTIIITKTLTAAGDCRSLMNNNVLGCFPAAAPQNTSLLVASALVASTNPSCSFQCTCTSITSVFTIDGTDGLPVELMDFSIEG